MRTRKIIVREVAFKRPDPKPQRAKTPTKPATAPAKLVKLEPPPPPQITETRVAEGHYELNPLMARMIDTELQDIMIKVWQALPDEPKTDAEKFVAEKFRNDAGDDFRNVLGLNVAKRLLNIFNRLSLKIQFTTVPARASLRSFLKKYSFVSFKRIENTKRSFSAQVKTIQDFDRLCSARDLWCGSSKVLVTPNYKFNERPEKLKSTSFEKSKEDKPKTEVKDNKEPLKAETKNTDEVKQPQKTEDAKAKPTQAKTTPAKTVTRVKPPASNTPAKSVQAMPPQSAPKVQAATQVKPTQAKPITQVTPTQTKSNTSTIQTKVNTQTKSNSATPTQAKTNTTANSTQAKPNTAPSSQAKSNTTPTQAKAAQANPEQVKPATAAQAKTNTPAKSSQSTPIKTNQAKPNTPATKTQNKLAQAKPQTKATPAKTQDAKKKTPQSKARKSFEEKGDFEELDDHDILALMSGGIVVDECIGSDEE